MTALLPPRPSENAKAGREDDRARPRQALGRRGKGLRGRPGPREKAGRTAGPGPAATPASPQRSRRSRTGRNPRDFGLSGSFPPADFGIRPRGDRPACSFLPGRASLGSGREAPSPEAAGSAGPSLPRLTWKPRRIGQAGEVRVDTHGPLLLPRRRRRQRRPLLCAPRSASGRLLEAAPAGPHVPGAPPRRKR